MENWDAFREYRRSTIWQKITGSEPVLKRDPLWENCFMLGHIGVNVRDLEQAKAYYDGLMPLLGFEPYIAATDQFAYRPVNSKPGAVLFLLSSSGRSALFTTPPGPATLSLHGRVTGCSACSPRQSASAGL